MNITKFGHACILVEKGGVAVLCDPGMWNELPTPEKLDAILITHEHQDHCDIGQLKALIEKFPSARVITHAAVGEKLKEAGIAYENIEPGAGSDVQGLPAQAGVSIQSFGTEHAHIYGGVSPCRNTGFLIGGELFVPGDALHDIPPVPVRVLALPTGGPWMRPSEAIDYAKNMKPKIVFPVHDAMYVEQYRGLIKHVVGGNLEPVGIAYVDMAAGDSKEF